MRVGTLLVLPILSTRAYSTVSAMNTIVQATATIKTNVKHIAAAESLMKTIYGDWDVLLEKGLFPKPLQPEEAGPSVVPYGTKNEVQRRYLWTDAFAILNFCSMAMRCNPDEEESRRRTYLKAADALIDAVQKTLGQPRDKHLYPMRVQDENGVPTPYGYKGLRIGKEKARKVSDAGMSYDGMYFHYLDKMLFALLRYSQVSGDRRRLEDAENLIKNVHPYFMAYYANGRSKRVPQGVYWKLNSDLSVPPGLEYTSPNDDALCGWLVYSLIRQSRRLECSSPIEKEWQEMDYVAAQYMRQGIRISSDGLGFGLLGWKQQWFDSSWAEPLRARLQLLAACGPLDVRTGMQLPFRLYGAIMGSRLLSSVMTGGPPGGRGADAGRLAERALDLVLDIELATEESPHSSINKVMLASALDPLAFSRLKDEPLLTPGRSLELS